ncbi:M4 family metallopeptidase [Actinoplanes sp. NPDC051343]|uniref:M4 family metallopeptidase n=1 Tax=Actinoplanes sp. NPDC051343 TaxID=3363906 RepID=UPI003798E5E2
MSRPLACFVPPHVLDQMSRADDPEIADAARATLRTTAQVRGRRLRTRPRIDGATVGAQRRVFDCRNVDNIDGAILVRIEDQAPIGDTSANRAFDALGLVRDFLREVFHRDSVDGAGLELKAYVHFASQFNNAGWDGSVIKIGDGDGKVMRDLTYGIDVVAHELAHGVTANTANFEYRGQPGALDESIADVVGTLVRQWSLDQSVDEADWLLGGAIFTPGIELDAMRSMKAPGTAYDNKLVGKDPQPSHMRDFMVLPETEDRDLGGVHINSGIPNHAFYLTATAFGGHAWEKAGRIWYRALLSSTPTTQFADFASFTATAGAEMFGRASSEWSAVVNSWHAAGIDVESRQ